VSGTQTLEGHSSITRRAFVRAGVAAGSLVVVPGAWARSSGSGPAARAAARRTLVRSHFTPLVGARVRLTGGGENVRAVLTHVADLASDGGEDQFALLFKLPRRARFGEGIRTVHHRGIGRVDLFVSPVDRGVRGRYYEAVINRRR
jgi:hypothetical protein